MAISSKSSVERERLVESHVPLVRSLARRYAGRGESLEELVQVGALGLVKAAKRFDEHRGVAFAAFATPVIEGEIRRHLRDRSSVVRIPRDAQRASGELSRGRGQLTASIGRFPSTEELAVALDTDRERIERALRVELAREALPLADGDQDPDRAGAGERHDTDERLSIARCVRGLDERSRTIVFLRFHADMTEREIARELHISQTQVSRLLTRALSRLRAELTNPGSDGSARDTNADEVISRGSAGEAGHDRTQNGERSCARSGGDGTTIAGVPASQQTSDLAHYLELPYTIGVRQERDGESTSWQATIEELPGCAAQGRTADEAVELLRGAMQRWLEAALEQGREIPVPRGEAAKQKSSSTHSGRFLVRMPGTLHAQLAQAAEGQQLSLNRFVTNVLAASLSGADPDAGAPRAAAERRRAREQDDARTGRPSRTLRVALAANVAVVVLAAAAAIVLLVLALHNGV